MRSFSLSYRAAPGPAAGEVAPVTAVLVLPVVVVVDAARFCCCSATSRNPMCWKKCFRKWNRDHVDAMSPVDAQDPPKIIACWPSKQGVEKSS